MLPQPIGEQLVLVRFLAQERPLDSVERIGDLG
jgi:hypothetical protein